MIHTFHLDRPDLLIERALQMRAAELLPDHLTAPGVRAKETTCIIHVHVQRMEAVILLMDRHPETFQRHAHQEVQAVLTVLRQEASQIIQRLHAAAIHLQVQGVNTMLRSGLTASLKEVTASLLIVRHPDHTAHLAAVAAAEGLPVLLQEDQDNRIQCV
jgi:3-deoxy-D-manno-octulosonic-acid transferase